MKCKRRASWMDARRFFVSAQNRNDVRLRRGRGDAQNGKFSSTIPPPCCISASPLSRVLLARGTYSLPSSLFCAAFAERIFAAVVVVLRGVRGASEKTDIGGAEFKCRACGAVFARIYARSAGLGVAGEFTGYQNLAPLVEILITDFGLFAEG